MLKDLLMAWQPYKGLTTPTQMPVKVWGSGGSGVWLSDEWGPPIPYRQLSP